MAWRLTVLLSFSYVFLGSVGLPVAAQEMEVVHFASAVAPPSALKLKQAKAAGIELKQEPGTPIWGHIGKPDGDGPFPAVVLMHGCAGIFQTQMRWAKFLNESGYVTLILDSFRPRSVFNICTSPFSKASPSIRALDAHGALSYLQGLSVVDPNRVAVIGWSHGGNSAMESISNTGIASGFERSFKAAIALYPFCLANWEFELPAMILLGEEDSWAPLNACLGVQRQSQGMPIPVKLISYKGVHHAYDEVELEKGWSVKGPGNKDHLLKYDADAYRDSKKQVHRFLAKYLSGS